MERIATKYVAMNPQQCVACWKCVDVCPKHILEKGGFQSFPHVAFNDVDACVGCKRCVRACPNGVFSKLEDTTRSVLSESRSRKKMSFQIERLLPLAFVVSAVSGIGLHIAGHGTIHEVWYNWAVVHVLFSLLCLISAIFHIKQHWCWYKSIIHNGIGGKSLITLALSVTFLTVTLTGLVLIAGVDGANSAVGLWHYKLGLLLIVFSLIHVFQRRRKGRKSELRI